MVVQPVNYGVDVMNGSRRMIQRPMQFATRIITTW
jgi:hypothetical protein